MSEAIDESTTESVPLFGRSSSHFTRVVRLFALELQVHHTFHPVLDLTSLDAATYAGNPALKIPVLVDEHGPLFGAENICRELLRRGGQRGAGVVLRAHSPNRALANAEELTLHVMSSGVSLVMSGIAGAGHLAPPKVVPSLHNGLRHLNETLSAALPSDRRLSFFEVTLFCALTHLRFREVTDCAAFPYFFEFCASFGERESAQATLYRFDAHSGERPRNLAR